MAQIVSGTGNVLTVRDGTVTTVGGLTYTVDGDGSIVVYSGTGSFPATGKDGVLYIAQLPCNRAYRWNGTGYTEVATGKPARVTSQENYGITLADNTEYYMLVEEADFSYPAGNFECWLRLTTAPEHSVTLVFPASTTYIGAAPVFAQGEVWEISIKDGVMIAQKVGDGT